MKKQGILNSEIAKVLADMGHTDTLCIGDCGLPVPADVKKIGQSGSFEPTPDQHNPSPCRHGHR